MIFWFCILKDAQKKLKEVEKELKKQIELQPVWDATVKGLHQDLRKRNKEVRDKNNYNYNLAKIFNVLTFNMDLFRV